jgi:hypothetical protein
MSWRRSLLFKGALLVLLALAVSGGFAWIADEAVDHYRGRHLRRVRDGADPATLALSDGKFKPRDSITLLLTRHPPKYVFRHDAYTTAEYYNGNRVTMAVARDGRLIFAGAGGSGQYPYTFLDAFAPGESRLYHASRERIVAQWTTAMAVVGPTAIIHCIPLDPPDPGHPK